MINEARVTRKELFFALLTIIAIAGCVEPTTSDIKTTTQPTILTDATTTVRPTTTSPTTTTISSSTDKGLEVHFIDVGQGDSSLIITPSGKTVLIDAGKNGMGYEVVDYLQSLGIDYIDIVIATHADADHIGGLDEVMESIEVDYVYDNGQTHTTQTYDDYYYYAAQQVYDDVEKDVLLELDQDVKIELIVPYDNLEGTNRDRNDNSILLKVSYAGVSVLFTGDCEKECENDILEGDDSPSVGDDIDVDILKVGHHGSRTSSSYEFLSEVTPELAIISAGEGNRYGHPHDEVLNSLYSIGADVYRTDTDETVVIEIRVDGTWEVN